MKPITNRAGVIITSLALWAVVSSSIADDSVPAPPAMSEKSSGTKSVVKQPKPDNTPPKEKQKQFAKPEVTIRQDGDTRIEEYRVNGQLRYSKITPIFGPAYYLVDDDGDGIFTRFDDLDNPPINQWILFEW